MTGSPSFHLALADQPSGHPRRHLSRLAAVAAAIVIGMVAIPALAPPLPPTAAEVQDDYITANAQDLIVPSAATVDSPVRDLYAATPGINTLVAGATNYDWAKLVLMFAGMPMTTDNITVMVRWMRQENYVDSWWNRNNPLNNGWGSGGGGGTGSYGSLVDAAQNAAEAFDAIGGYATFVSLFRAGAPAAEIEAAIWASPWASGHYANGGHWSYAEVPVITAPTEAWG